MTKRTIQGLLGVAVGIGVYYRFGGELPLNALLAFLTSSAGAFALLVRQPRWTRLVVAVLAGAGAVAWTLWTHEVLRGERRDEGPDPTVSRADPRVTAVHDAWLLPSDDAALHVRATGLSPRVDLAPSAKGTEILWENAPPQIPPIVVPRARPWRFAMWADSRGGARAFQDVREGIQRADALAFSVGVGDLVGMARPYQFEVLALQMTTTRHPAFFVPGNHDLDPFGTLRPYARVLGPRQWSFVSGDVLFVGLDSAHGHIADDDATWAETVVQGRGKDVKDVVFFCHYPIFPPTRADKALPQGEAATKRVQALAQEAKALCFSGNWHAYDKTTHGAVTQIVAGGAGSKPEAPGPHFFVLATVAEDGIHTAKMDVISPDDVWMWMDRVRVFCDETAWTSHRMALRFLVGWLLAVFALGGVVASLWPQRSAPTATTGA